MIGLSVNKQDIKLRVSHWTTVLKERTETTEIKQRQVCGFKKKFGYLPKDGDSI
jgi:hypothetical protein